MVLETELKKVDIYSDICTNRRELRGKYSSIVNYKIWSMKKRENIEIYYGRMECADKQGQG